MNNKIDFIQNELASLEKKSAEELLSWALKTFQSKIALACSFQCEESVLIDMLYKLSGRGHFRVFTLDTGRLNP